MPRIVHFEIPSEEPDRTIDFYSKTFGWRFKKWDGPMEYWLIETGEGNGINGGLMRRMAEGQPMTSIIGVSSIDEYTQRIEGAGGRIVVPKTPIPGVGYFAYFIDLDGHIVGLHEVNTVAA